MREIRNVLPFYYYRLCDVRGSIRIQSYFCVHIFFLFLAGRQRRYMFFFHIHDLSKIITIFCCLNAINSVKILKKEKIERHLVDIGIDRGFSNGTLKLNVKVGRVYYSTLKQIESKSLDQGKKLRTKNSFTMILSFLKNERDRTVIVPISYRNRTAIVPRSYQDRTVIIPWLYRGRTVNVIL